MDAPIKFGVHVVYHVNNELTVSGVYIFPQVHWVGLYGKMLYVNKVNQ